MESMVKVSAVITEGCLLEDCEELELRFQSDEIVLGRATFSPNLFEVSVEGEELEPTDIEKRGIFNIMKESGLTTILEDDMMTDRIDATGCFYSYTGINPTRFDSTRVFQNAKNFIVRNQVEVNNLFHPDAYLKEKETIDRLDEKLTFGFHGSTLKLIHDLHKRQERLEKINKG